MNAAKWIAYFESNRGRFQEPDWTLPTAMPPGPQRAVLAETLAIFQLGETGGGTRLRRYVRRHTEATRLPGYMEAIDYFVAEEQAHGELLKKMVLHLGGTLLQKQWSNSLFRNIRNWINLEFNIQVLLTAEIVARAYFGLLQRHVAEPAIRQCCAKILHDEVGHISFQIDFFRSRLSTMSPLKRWLWRTQFWTLCHVAKLIVWFDHGRRLKLLGIGRGEFFAHTAKSLRHFLKRLASEPAGAAAWRPAPQPASD